MARVTVEDCIDKVDNRFELVLLASHRARLISSGAPLTIDRDRDKNPVVALREIADETIAPDDLQGAAHPLAAEIRRGRRAGGRDRSAAHDQPRAAAAAATGSGDDSEVQFDRMSEEDLLRGLEGLVPPAAAATTRTDGQASSDLPKARLVPGFFVGPLTAATALAPCARYSACGLAPSPISSV